LGKFGEAMKDFDRFDQSVNDQSVGTSTVFVMFDMLTRLASGGVSASAASLSLKTEVDGRETEKLFLSEDAGG
jgi:hypothetical protein